MTTCKVDLCGTETTKDNGGYCSYHQRERAEAAEKRVKELEAQLAGAAQTIVTLTGERDTAQATCERMNETIKKIAKERGDAREERDAAQLELQQIRTMLDDGCNGESNTALDMVKRLHAQCYAFQREKWYQRT